MIQCIHRYSTLYISIMKTFLYIVICSVLMACSAKDNTKNQDVVVMSFNMRYDNPNDGDNRWNNRKDIVAQTITDAQTDIVGTQELLHNQLNDLKSLLPNYRFIGTAREDGISKGEYSAIIYKNESFDLLDSGSFWISETPEEVGSKGWDGACERIATWAILSQPHNDQELFILNTHLDHMGVEARRQGVALLLSRIQTLAGDRPIIVTGDFNATPQSDVILQILGSGQLQHAKDIAKAIKGESWTFDDFGRLDTLKRSFIDYIFVNDSIEVKSHEVLPITTIDGRHLSDHAPVKAILTIK